MKKTLLMMAVAAGAMLTGCVKNETANGGAVSGSKISFEAPAVTGITRTALVPGEMVNPYDQGEHFSVYALYFADGTYTNFDAGTLYMDNVETAYNAGGQYWDSESVPGGQAYYWPKKGSLTFAAYSPSGAANDCTVAWGAAGFTFTDFTVQDDPADHYDLMFSERSYDRVQSTGGTTYNGVDINFKHALSSVVFKLKLAEVYDGHTITVTSIKLQNAYTKGDFNQQLEDTNNAPTTEAAAWMGQNTEYADGYEAVTAAAGEVVGSTDATPLTNPNPIIVLPQQLTHDPNHVQIAVAYTIHNGTAEVNYNETIDITDVKYNLTEFEIGKRYTFTLIFGLDKITFSPEVAEWEDVNVPNIEL